ncbi:hypothetical protein WR25_13972 [Diploscapter pachys]|uniref:Uncharacterized protein n=1 Tax=Diploscapter pachys TaxID=2018661 RepID=A0A2A2M3D4_9BILA|nr:hypothetical protein WR25_13972 [Diploscapter pachys]
MVAGLRLALLHDDRHDVLDAVERHGRVRLALRTVIGGIDDRLRAEAFVEQAEVAAGHGFEVLALLEQVDVADFAAAAGNGRLFLHLQRRRNGSRGNGEKRTGGDRAKHPGHCSSLPSLEALVKCRYVHIGFILTANS